jgi:hypothetical protein
MIVGEDKRQTHAKTKTTNRNERVRIIPTSRSSLSCDLSTSEWCLEARFLTSS